MAGRSTLTMLDQDETLHEEPRSSGPRPALGKEGDPDVRYWKLRQVGAGSYGEAWLVRTSTEPKKELVAKVMNIPKMSERDLHYAYSEIKCLTRLRHPNIIEYVEDFEEGDNLYIVMEFANCGDLDRQIRSRSRENKLFQEHEVLFMFLQLAMALDHIHSKKMLHRDLKAANIFLTSNGMVKLGDFGFSHDYEETVSHAVAKTFCGTPYYLAPELWKNKKYGKKADVWSLGVVLYEVVTLKRPFNAESMKQLMLVVLNEEPEPLPSTWSDGMSELVKACLVKDHNHRPNTRELYSLEYMQEGNDMYESAVKRSGNLTPEAKQQLLDEIGTVRSCRGIKLQPNTLKAQEICCDGPIRKLGTAERQWRDRYLYLREAKLIICAQKDGVSDGKGLPLGRIRSVCAVASNAAREENVFGIETNDGRATWLQAESAEALDTWLEKIQLALSLLD